jgi:hypothetical protein
VTPLKNKAAHKQPEIEAERRIYSHPRIGTETLSKICYEWRRTIVDRHL